VKSAAEEDVDEKKVLKNCPWFDEEFVKLHEERKQARQQWLSNETKSNANHNSNVKRKATHGFRNKMQIYLPRKSHEIENNCKTSNIIDLYKGANSLRKD